VGDFVQFTGRLVYENETLYITLVSSTLLRNRSSESHVPDNELPISTPSMTTTVVLASPPKKLSNVRFFQAVYNEYNAVTNNKRVEQVVNVVVREEDTRLVNATNKLTNDRPFVISGLLTIGEDKMFLLELVDIDILFQMTVLAPRHVPSSQKSNSTSRYASIVQEIKNQAPPSPTSPINHRTTISPPVPKTQTLTPISTPGSTADPEFQRFYTFYQAFQQQQQQQQQEQQQQQQQQQKQQQKQKQWQEEVNDDEAYLQCTSSEPSPSQNIKTEYITTAKRTRTKTPSIPNKRRQTRSSVTQYLLCY